MSTIELSTVFAFRRFIEQVGTQYIWMQYSDTTISFRLANNYEDILNFSSNAVIRFSRHLLPILLALNFFSDEHYRIIYSVCIQKNYRASEELHTATIQ